LSDGWVAGLVLMSEAVKQENIEPELVGIHTFKEIFSYFAQEVFGRLDEKTREFLLFTSFLPKMTAPMAEDLSGNRSASFILRGMHCNNYFVSGSSSSEPVYAYHPLYRDFLRSRADDLLPRETLIRLRRRAASLLEKAGQTESALALLLDNGDWDGMVGIIVSHAPQMLEQGRYLSLRQWFDNLPPEVIGANPWLLYWEGMSALSFDPRSARQCFEQAFTGFQTAKDQVGSVMAASGVVNAIVYGWNDFKPLDHWYMVLSDLATTAGTFSGEIEASAVASILMAIAMRDMYQVDTETWERRAMQIVETPSTVNIKFHALHFAFWYRLMIGNVAKALPFLDELRRLSRVRYAQPLTAIGRWLLEMIYHLYTGSHDEVLKAVKKGLDVAKKTGVHVEDMWFYANGIVSLISRMDLEGAQNWLDKIRPGLDDWPNYPKSLYHIQLMRMAAGPDTAPLIPRDRSADTARLDRISVRLGSLRQSLELPPPSAEPTEMMEISLDETEKNLRWMEEQSCAPLKRRQQLMEQMLSCLAPC